MTGATKHMNLPVLYHIRVKRKTLEKLKKIGSKKVRKCLEEFIKNKN
ncbi:MAG: hypothetical protein KKG75_04030 [Nanoarchaeota archaeon]|nr:hypothetical protein [Nanoarchaeota archaeon]